MADLDKVTCVFCITDGALQGFRGITPKVYNGTGYPRAAAKRACGGYPVHLSFGPVGAAGPALLCRSYAKAKQGEEKVHINIIKLKKSTYFRQTQTTKEIKNKE